jgi:pimeloyl-ACP methyl ester carboxylesterase
LSQYYIKLFVAAFIAVSLAINISINVYANVFAQAGLINPNKINVLEIATKKVHVGDIDIAYKIFGKGQPVLLINGFSAPLDFWEPTFLGKLASNHTVVTFDNRGIGNTTSGDNKFTIPQFANDASGLLDALNISNADIIGWSMGGMIAQELALTHPDKVGKLIIYASTCGGKETVQPNPEIV